MKKASRKSGFTLVELLVVIAIIGILVGILIPAVGAARVRATNFAIQANVTTMEAALEQFKSKHGFFPPDMSKIDSAAEFLPYLNRISRNHGEGNGSAGSGLQIWWDEVGSNLTPETSLAFWLTGLANNAQFPLTFAVSPGTRAALPAYNVGVTDMNGIEIERKVLLDLPAKQVVTLPGTTTADMLARYNQPRGATLQPMLYFSASSYDVFIDTTSGPLWQIVPTASLPANVQALGVWPYFQSEPTGAVPEGSEDSFQIVTAGADGIFGVTGDIVGVGPRDNDNIVSFAEGRLQTLLQQ